MASYADMDEETLQAKLSDAESYEERSLIRQALRQKKKERGELVKRSRGGGSVYNRFASTTRSTAPSPKNYVASAQSVKPNTGTPPRRATPVEQVDVPPHVEEDPQPSPPPREPTPPPREPTPPPQEPTPPPREPTPPPQEPTPPPQEPTPTPPDTPPSEEEVEELDGCIDPGVGEEGVSQSPPPAEMEEEEESVETPHKTRDRTIEEDTDDVRSGAQTKGGNFGVKLKATPPKTQSKPPTRPSPSAAPRTLRDYQELSARSKASRPLTPDDRPIVGGELQQYLVAYVNRELGLRPPLPARGRALFETAADPANLCKLINKSVRDTVDLRALTKMPTRGSATAKKEALEENMMLAVESARAIGCRVSDDTGSKILSGDPDIIRAFLVDLIRARVVHMPAMDDEPSSTFTNLPLLFSKLDICLESVDGGGDVGEEATPMDTPPSQEKEAVTYEERAAMRKEERERKRSGEPADQGQEMTYEERAAKRRLERERRRKEREALAK